jgi:hypothetical protein
MERPGAAAKRQSRAVEGLDLRCALALSSFRKSTVFCRKNAAFRAICVMVDLLQSKGLLKYHSVSLAWQKHAVFKGILTPRRSAFSRSRRPAGRPISRRIAATSLPA